MTYITFKVYKKVMKIFIYIYIYIKDKQLLSKTQKETPKRSM